MTGAPPFEAGAVHDTTDWALPPVVAVAPVGAPGTVDGVAGTVGQVIDGVLAVVTGIAPAS